MDSPAPAYHLLVGIDIAAATFTAAWAGQPDKPGAPVTLGQTPHGFAALQERPQATGIAPDKTLVVREATSTDWVALAITLHEAGGRVSVINPFQAYHFARTPLRGAKADDVDAQESSPACG